ncbi:hypothetical protein MRX96_012081 [Rhipicephalus microplus]
MWRRKTRTASRLDGEENSMPAETEKGADENLGCAADAKEVADKAAPKDEGECADQTAENVNAEEFTEVEEKIVEGGRRVPRRQRKCRRVSASR